MAHNDGNDTQTKAATEAKAERRARQREVRTLTVVAAMTSDKATTAALARIDEAARFLGMSRSWIYEAMDRGDLDYVRLGDRTKKRAPRRIPWKALHALAERYTVTRAAVGE